MLLLLRHASSFYATTDCREQSGEQAIKKKIGENIYMPIVKITQPAMQARYTEIAPRAYLLPRWDMRQRRDCLGLAGRPGAQARCARSMALLLLLLLLLRHQIQRLGKVFDGAFRIVKFLQPEQSQAESTEVGGLIALQRHAGGRLQSDREEFFP